MSTKLNLPILIFALMIQVLFCGIIFILPASITSTFPSFVNPSILMQSIGTPSGGFGISSISFTTTCTSSYCTCDYTTLYLGCIGYPFWLLFQVWGAIFNFLIMGLNIIMFIANFAFQMFIFFFASSYYVISIFPNWISLPLGFFMMIINIFVVIDIALVAKGLIENII